MAASSTISPELGQISRQGKLDLLLVGDATVCFLVGVVQKFFSNIAHITITVSDVKKVAALVHDCALDMVFLKVTSVLSAEELEAVKSIRFGKKKNTHLLFVFIIPENFKEYGADVTFTEPLTMEKMNIVIKYWKTYFINAVKSENAVLPEQPGLLLQSSHGEHLGYFSTHLFTCSELLRNNIGLQLKVPLPEMNKSKKGSFLHSSKEKLRRERIKYCCEQLRALLPYVKGRKNDVASVLEATVDYVKYVREKISPAIMGQITEVLQRNGRFCKRQTPIELFFPATIVTQRDDTVLTNTYSPVREIQLLFHPYFNMFLTSDAKGFLEEAVRATIVGLLTANV